VRQCDERREHLSRLSALARKELVKTGLSVGGEAHILSLEVGDEGRCHELAAKLRDEGILVFAARYPTVPLGQAILRVCLTTEHDADDVIRLREALSRLIHKESA
jgi:8-amino-7-oxononanoate synthase